MIGPLTETEAAAVDYRDQWGWPAFASNWAVWLRLPPGMAALSVIDRHPETGGLRQALEDLLGPVIDYGDDHYVVLTHCDVLRTGHVSGDDFDAAVVVHLGSALSVDLPPTMAIRGGRATWLHAPGPDQAMPGCASVLVQLRRLVEDQ